MFFVIERVRIKPAADEARSRNVFHDESENIANDAQEGCGQNNILGFELIDRCKN